ncbi:MAG: hypothetical protein ACE5FU_01270 [Nitrospinota bacterium]
MRIILLVLIAFILPVNAQMLTYDEFKKSRQQEPTQKNTQISRKYKRYIDKMREPILLWGLGYLGSTSVDMKGKLKLSFGKGKEINTLWTSMNISKNLQVGGAYSFFGKKNYLPKFYFFAGGGLGVELLPYDTYVYTGLNALYFFNRKLGVQVALNTRLDKPEGINSKTVGVFFQYRM